MKSSLDFEELLQTHLNDLYSLALRLSGSKEVAEDLVQDLFVNLRLGRIRPTKVRNPRAWLATILYRMFVNHWRREKRSPVSLVYDRDSTGKNSDPVENTRSDDPGPLENLEQDISREKLARCLERLGDKHRDVLIMHDVEGYSLVEIQRIMQIPEGTLKSRLHRARDKMQQLLIKMEPIDAFKRTNRIE